MATSDLAGALARTLQSLRAERGWSLDQLAARSGVSKGVLVALEQARSNPNLATLARISDAFGVPVTYLVDVPAEPSVRVTGPGATPGPMSPRSASIAQNRARSPRSGAWRRVVPSPTPMPTFACPSAPGNSQP